MDTTASNPLVSILGDNVDKESSRAAKDYRRQGSTINQSGVGRSGH